MEEQAQKNVNLQDSINNPMPHTVAAVDELNDDCLTYIFSFLHIKDRIKIERVCKRWQAVSKKSWQNIKTLNSDKKIWGFDPLSMTRSSQKLTSIFEKVLYRCGYILTCVDFSGLSVKNNVMYHVAKTCPNLQSLNAGPLNLTFPVVKIMTANCHNVREITFSTCSKPCNDYHLSRFFLQNNKLRYLKMIGNENLTGKCLSKLPKESMETIIINDCFKISPQQVADAVKNFDNLQILSLIENHNWSKLSEPNVMIDSLSKGLTELRIRDFAKIDSKIIVTLTNLQILDISRAHLTDAFLVTLSENCKELLNLNLNDCFQVTNVGIKAISRLPKLEELSLKNLRNITDEALKYIPKLKKLSCAHCCKMQDDGLCTLISSCDTIEYLDCSHCEHITNNLVKCAVKATKLRTNGVLLKLDVRGTFAGHDDEIDEQSPLLEIVRSSPSEDSMDDMYDDMYDDDDEWMNNYYWIDRFGYNPFQTDYDSDDLVYGYGYEDF